MALIAKANQSVTANQIEAEMIADIERACAPFWYVPGDEVLGEAFRLGRDIGYNKREVRKLAYVAVMER